MPNSGGAKPPMGGLILNDGHGSTLIFLCVRLPNFGKAKNALVTFFYVIYENSEEVFGFFQFVWSQTIVTIS